VQVPLLVASAGVNVVKGALEARRVRKARKEGGDTEAEGDVLDQHRVHPITLEWRGLECAVRNPKTGHTKELLRGVSGAAKPGRLVAIMGPSGSGKTTLLNALAGQVPRTKGMTLRGAVELNGTPQAASHVKIGYVQQEDLFFSQLTVAETLTMAAQLRFPASTPVEAIEAFVDHLLTRLGLGKSRDTVVGDAKTRGLSGGEKKRLSIACELVGSPSCLFLDEPTSGLDAFQAERVVRTLKALAAQGHTVVCSIHQPRSSIFREFDDLVLMSEGACVYAGPADGAVPHFASLGHACPPSYNPADFFIDLVSIDFTSPETEAATRGRLEALVAGAVDRLSPSRGSLDQRDALVITEGQERPRSGWWRQLRLLFQRSFRQSTRDKATNGARLGSSIGSAVIFGSIFARLGLSQVSIQDRFGLMQVVAVNTAMGSITKTLSVFPKERTIVSRERAKNSYNVAPYFAAKLLAELPIGALFPAAFGAIVYPACGLNARLSRFLRFMGILTAESFASSAIGLTMGSVAPNADTALVLGPLLMVIFIVFGGLYVTEESVPWPLRWVPKVSLIKQAFEALVVNELSGMAFDASRPGDLASGDQALGRRGFDPLALGGARKPVVQLGRILLFNYWMAFHILRAKKPMFQKLEAPAEVGGGKGTGGTGIPIDVVAR